ADVGQSEIGPPGAIGMARVERPVGALSDLRTRGLAFVGDTSPFGHMLPVTLGVMQLVRRARERGAELVVVDTSGLVAGRFAEKLKLAKVEAIRPELVLVFRRAEEMERLSTLLSALADVASVTPPPEVRRKSPAFRRARRQRQWSAWFRGASLHELIAAEVQTVDAWAFTGRP